MTIDHFLQYWSRNNTLIIEVLIGIILLTVIYLAFRAFFASRNSESTASLDGGGLNVEQLEKTLQKILANQQPTKPRELSPIELAELEASGGGGEAIKVELNKAKQELAEKEKIIQDLKAKSTEVAAPAGATSVVSNAASKELEIKVKELEARLSEYEIISEDIADLSFYKEENTKLKKENETLKSGAVSAPVPAPAPAPDPGPALEPEMKSAPEIAEPEPDLKKPSLADQLFEAAVTPAVSAENKVSPEQAPEPEPVSAGNPAIDDDLMKEFAAAVEGQKKASHSPMGADAPAEAAQDLKFPVEENKQLMKEFEDFTGKKVN